MAKEESSSEILDVIIIGGGLSGLSAAWELKKREPDIKIKVIEAKERLGGRTLTVTLPTAHGVDVWDMGGQWVSSSHKHLLDLLSELNIQIYPQYTTGKKLLQLTGQTVKSYTGNIPDLNLFTLLDIEHGIRKVDKLSNQLSAENFYDHPQASDLDSITVETLRNQLLWTEDATRLMDIGVETVFGNSVRQISALFFLHFCGTSGGFRKLIEASRGAAQELRIKGGAQQISDLLADKIGRQNIILSSPVTQIKQTEESVSVSTASGERYLCDRVLIAIPLPQNNFIEFEPHLPTSKTFIHRNMPIGNLVKFIAVYDRPFWREQGFSGEVLNEGKFEDSYEPVDVVYDATTYNGNAALVGFMSAQRGLWWTDANADERKQAVLKTLARFFGEDTLAPVSYLEKNWYYEPYNGGCPIASAGPGLMENFHHHKARFGRLHWAGTETSDTCMGYMEGAVASGLRGARELLFMIRPNALSPTERSQIQESGLKRRKSQMLRIKHKVFRYTIAFALAAIGIVIFKKMYFRIAL